MLPARPGAPPDVGTRTWNGPLPSAEHSAEYPRSAHLLTAGLRRKLAPDEGDRPTRRNETTSARTRELEKASSRDNRDRPVTEKLINGGLAGPRRRWYLTCQPRSCRGDSPSSAPYLPLTCCDEIFNHLDRFVRSRHTSGWTGRSVWAASGRITGGVNAPPACLVTPIPAQGQGVSDEQTRPL